MKRGWKSALPWVAVVLLGWVVLSELRGGSPLPTGTIAPALNVQQHDGSTFDLAAHRGQVVVVNFWATWCPPCRAEAPVLDRAATALLARGGAFVGVSADDAPVAAIVPTARRLGMTYPLAHGDGPLLAAWNVTLLPTTYVIARDGTLVRAFVGEVAEGPLNRAIRQAESR